MLFAQGSVSKRNKQMKNPKHRVTVNKGAVRQMALNGTALQAEQLFLATAPAVKRLGLAPAKAFRRQPRYEGGKPGVHDVMRWIGDLDADSPAEELAFLRQLNSTVRARLPQKVVDKVEAEA